MSWSNKMRALLREQQGLSTVEYVVVLVLIVGLSVALWNELGGDVSKALGNTKDKYKTNVVEKSGG